MKELKIIFAILFTFILAFITSTLFEWKFISSNWLRTSLVVMFVVLELVVGFMYVKSELLKFKTNSE